MNKELIKTQLLALIKRVRSYDVLLYALEKHEKVIKEGREETLLQFCLSKETQEYFPDAWLYVSDGYVSELEGYIEHVCPTVTTVQTSPTTWETRIGNDN